MNEKQMVIIKIIPNVFLLLVCVYIYTTIISEISYILWKSWNIFVKLRSYHSSNMTIVLFETASLLTKVNKIKCSLLTVTNNSGNIKNTKDSDIKTTVILSLMPSTEDCLTCHWQKLWYSIQPKSWSLIQRLVWAGVLFMLVDLDRDQKQKYLTRFQFIKQWGLNYRWNVHTKTFLGFPSVQQSYCI